MRISGALRIQLALTGGADQRVEPPCLVRGGAASLWREREVLAPWIGRVGTVLRRDQPLVGESAPGLIKRAGGRVEAAARLCLDVPADRIAVRGAVAEGEQDVEREIGESRRGSIRHAGTIRRG